MRLATAPRPIRRQQGRYGGNHEQSHILLLLCMIPKSRLSVKIMRRRNIVPREELGRANNWPGKHSACTKLIAHQILTAHYCG
jgi:hypothetical protein